MWQRFTERARKVVFYAQEEATKRGHRYVATEHLLFGLCREKDNVAGRILTTMGVSIPRIVAELEKVLPEKDPVPPGSDMTLVPRAKRVIDLSYDEARHLNNDYIGTEHLLLGLIREGDGLAGRVLFKLGVTLEAARHGTKDMQAMQGSRDAHNQDVSGPAHQALAQLRKKLKDPIQLMAQFLLIRQGRSLQDFLALIALCSDQMAADSLAKAGVRTDQLVLELETSLTTQIVNAEDKDATSALNSIWKLAEEQVSAENEPVMPIHILMAILGADEGATAVALKSQGVTSESFRNALNKEQA